MNAASDAPDYDHQNGVIRNSCWRQTKPAGAQGSCPACLMVAACLARLTAASLVSAYRSRFGEGFGTAAASNKAPAWPAGVSQPAGHS